MTTPKRSGLPVLRRAPGLDHSTSDEAVLDGLSKRIIEQLQEDGRRSYAAIGRAIGLSEAAVRQRVERLREQEVIKITAVADAKSVGFHREAMVAVKVDGDVRLVAEKLAAVPETDYVVICAGSFDLLVELICVDDEHLLQLVNGAIRTIPGVSATETFVYLKVAKETYTWGTR